MKYSFYASLLALSFSIYPSTAGADGAIVWACTSADIPSQYLPSNCSGGDTPTPTVTPTPVHSLPPDDPCIAMPSLCGGGSPDGPPMP